MTWPSGVLTALVTPLFHDELNIDVLEDLIEYQLAAGVSGFVIGGGTGEYGALSIEERRRLAREAVRIIDGRVAAVVQTGALATRDSIALSQDAAAAGASGLLIASPFGEPINWAERRRFYEDVSAGVELPIMIYNTPPSGLLSLEELKDLARLPNVSAVKDSSGDPVFMGDLLEWAAGSEFGVYVGLDSFLYDAISAGATGAVFGAANVVPGPVSSIARQLRSDGPSSESYQRWKPLRSFLRFMEQSPNYMALCKAGCEINGLHVGEVRPPYLMPESAEIAELADRLARINRLYGA